MKETKSLTFDQASEMACLRVEAQEHKKDLAKKQAIVDQQDKMIKLRDVAIGKKDRVIELLMSKISRLEREKIPDQVPVNTPVEATETMYRSSIDLTQPEEPKGWQSRNTVWRNDTASTKKKREGGTFLNMGRNPKTHQGLPEGEGDIGSMREELKMLWEKIRDLSMPAKRELKWRSSDWPSRNEAATDRVGYAGGVAPLIGRKRGPDDLLEGSSEIGKFPPYPPPRKTPRVDVSLMMRKIVAVCATYRGQRSLERLAKEKKADQPPE